MVIAGGLHIAEPHLKLGRHAVNTSLKTLFTYTTLNYSHYLVLEKGIKGQTLKRVFAVISEVKYRSLKIKIANNRILKRGSHIRSSPNFIIKT
jgi:hypothetical protein